MLRKGPAVSKRTKHLNIRYFHFTDYVNLGELDVKHVSAKDMVADSLTKPLPGDVFIYSFRDKLLGYGKW